MILTSKMIDAALKGEDFWLYPESKEAKAIEEATKLGYVRRTSHTQAEWTSQAEIDKLDQLVKKVSVDNVSVIYQADEVYNSIDEMFESKLAVEMFTMYENEIPKKKRIIANSFQKGYRIGNKILYELLLDEGFKVLHELHLHSSLSSQGFNSYIMIPENKIFIIRSNYENTSPNRKQFAKQNINVTYIYSL